MIRRTGMAAVGLALALLVQPSPTRSEIYRWTDENGILHFTQFLDQVPPHHRKAARDATRGAGKSRPESFQTYSTDSTTAAPAPAGSRVTSGNG